MTPPEFTTWLSFHQASFPSVKDWATRRRDEWQSIRTVWQELFEDVELELAKRATRLMLRGDIEQPKFVEEQIRAIRTYAIGIANDQRRDVRNRRTADGQQTFACRICLDELVITCWHQSTVEAFREGKLTGAKVYTSVVFCDCDAARDRQAKWANPKKPNQDKREVPTYDPARHCRVIGRKTLEYAMHEIGDWLADPSKCATYNQGFDDWNNG